MSSQLRTYDGPTLTLVVNPAAGRGRAQKLLPAVCAELVTGLQGVNLRVFQTTDYAEARLRCISVVEGARPAIPGRPRDALVVMGGDGMVHLGLNACAGTDVPLGVLPAGTGNDFARSIGVSTNAVAAAKVVAKGITKRIDLAQVQGDLVDGAQQRWVGSVLSTGYDSMVTARADSMTWPRGSFRYGTAAMAVLARFEPLPYRLIIDGKYRSQDAMLVAIGNAGYYGGGMKILPNACLTDGLLDITIIHPVSRATLLRILPSLYTGGFVRDPAAELLTAKEVQIDGAGLVGMADGELLGDTPLTIRAVPDSLTVFVSKKDTM